jgi:hypothetical protein
MYFVALELQDTYEHGEFIINNPKDYHGKMHFLTNNKLIRLSRRLGFTVLVVD